MIRIFRIVFWSLLTLMVAVMVTSFVLILSFDASVPFTLPGHQVEVARHIVDTNSIVIVQDTNSIELVIANK